MYFQGQESRVNILFGDIKVRKKFGRAAKKSGKFCLDKNSDLNDPLEPFLFLDLRVAGDRVTVNSGRLSRELCSLVKMARRKPIFAGAFITCVLSLRGLAP